MALPIKEYLGQSTIFDLHLIDLPDTVEHALHYRFCVLKREWASRSNEDIIIEAIKQASRSQESIDDLTRGMLYGILTDSSNAAFVPISVTTH